MAVPCSLGPPQHWTLPHIELPSWDLFVIDPRFLEKIIMPATVDEFGSGRDIMTSATRKELLGTACACQGDVLRVIGTFGITLHAYVANPRTNVAPIRRAHLRPIM
jgi:hypothetical protein